MVDTRNPSEAPSILVVDDDEAFLDLTRRAFAREQWFFQAATSGHAALLRVSEADFAVVLLDYRLPDMDGLEVLRRIRENSLPPPVLLISGFGCIPSVVEAMKLGAVGFLEKPILMSDLVSQLRVVIGNHDRRAKLSLPLKEILRMIMAVVRAPDDIRSVESWARFVGMSRRALYSRFANTRIEPKDALDLGRLLRAAGRATVGRQDIRGLLDCADDRTVAHLLDRAGVSEDFMKTASQYELLRRQVLVRHKSVVAGLAAEIEW